MVSRSFFGFLSNGHDYSTGCPFLQEDCLVEKSKMAEGS